MARHTARALVVAMVALLLTGSVRLVQEAGAAGGSASVTSSLLAPAPGLAGPGIPEGSREIPSLRRRESRTYAKPDGSYVAEVSAGSVNYRDAKGDWQAIDNSLVASSAAGYGFENKANRYRVQLPSDLSAAPVRVSEGDAWLSFKLQGAGGRAAVAGEGARFAGALPGVEVAYRVMNDLVKETLTLASTAAPSSFTWTLQTSASLSAAKDARGGIDFRDSSGVKRLAFERPFMTDAAGQHSDAVSFSLSKSASGYSLTLSYDRRWLEAAGRAWPVVIDPVVSLYGAAQDCYIASGIESHSNLCGYTHDRVSGQRGAVAGDTNNAAGLDGLDDYGTVANSSSLNPASAITLEAWVKPVASTNFDNQVPIVLKSFTSHTAPYYQYGLMLMDAPGVGMGRHIGFHLALDGNWTYLHVNNTGWRYNAWNHIVATYENGAMKVYLNGDFKAGKVAWGTISSYATPLTLAAYENLPKTPANLYKGYLDEVAIYPRALPADQIKGHYDSALALTGTPYVSIVQGHGATSYWRLGEAWGATALADSSGSGNSGSYRNGVLLGAQAERALLKFNLEGVVPRDARVIGGPLYLNLKQQVRTAAEASLHEVTRSWTQALTWRTADGTSAWTPGGDYTGAAATRRGIVQGATGWQSFPLHKLVRAWVNGTRVNNGLLVKLSNEADAGEFVFDNSRSGNLPVLYVSYVAGEERPFQTFVDEQLTDRSALRVNVATGDLIVHSSDLQITGTGLDLNLVRSYHSREPSTRSSFGNGWSLEGGADVWVEETGDGSEAHLIAPSLGRVVFEKNADGSFQKPPGMNATLTRDGYGYTLSFDRTGGKWFFPARGWYLEWEKDRNGNTLDYVYQGTGDGNERLASILDTQGRSTSFAYAAPGSRFVTSITDPASRSHGYAYSSNLLTSYTAPDGSVTGYSYDASGNLIEIVDPRGNSTTLTYDVNRRVTAISRRLDASTNTWVTTRFSYDPANRTTVVTDANGSASRYSWDPELRVTSVTDAAANVFRTSYTANSDVATMTNANGHVTTNVYDASNRLVSAQLPTGATRRLEYGDARHPYLPTRSIDAQGIVLDYAYDANGNVLSQANQRATENQQRWAYNADGTVARHTDFKGNVTSYGYSGGNLISVDNPEPLGDLSYRYDSLSRIELERDGKAQEKTYSYDLLDRVTGLASAAGAIGYTYDANGNQTSVSDLAGGSTYVYDRLNRLTNEYVPNDRLGIAYSYDAAGNVTGVVDRSRTVTYGYDNRGLLTTLVEPDGRQITFAYDANGNRTTTNFPNGVSEYQLYDPSERLTRIYSQRVASNELFKSYSYSYRASGQQDSELRQTMTNTAGQVTSYSYDLVSNLTRAARPGDTREYAYDANGNRIQKTINGVATSYAYNAADELISAAKGGQTTTYAYDANGNRTGSSTGQAFTYNALDQTTSITPPTGGAAIAMAYSGVGQAERVSAGGASFVHSALGVVSRTASPTVFYTRAPDSELLEMETISGDFYYLEDGDGSIVGLTDEAGALVNDYEYDAFGEQIIEHEAVENPFEFAAMEEDESTGLSLTGGGEYFDADTGDVTQPDKCRFVDSSQCGGLGGIIGRIGRILKPPRRSPPAKPRATTPLGQAWLRLKVWRETGKGRPWSAVETRTEPARSYKGALNIETKWVEAKTNFWLIEQKIVKGGKVLHGPHPRPYWKIPK